MRKISNLKSNLNEREISEIAKKAKVQSWVQMIRFPACRKKVTILSAKDKDKENLKGHFKKIRWLSWVKMKEDSVTKTREDKVMVK